MVSIPKIVGCVVVWFRAVPGSVVWPSDEIRLRSYPLG
jgi:hypothetical protein